MSIFDKSIWKRIGIFAADVVLALITVAVIVAMLIPVYARNAR
jgi:hypothetical protein